MGAAGARVCTSVAQSWNRSSRVVGRVLIKEFCLKLIIAVDGKAYEVDVEVPEQEMAPRAYPSTFRPRRQHPLWYPHRLRPSHRPSPTGAKPLRMNRKYAGVRSPEL